MSELAAIQIEDLTRHFVVGRPAGRLRREKRRRRAVDGISFTVERGRVRRLHRRERRRQVHDDQDAHRHPGADRRPRAGRAAWTRCGSARAGPADRRGVRPAQPAVVGPAAGRLVRAAGRDPPAAGAERAPRGWTSCVELLDLGAVPGHSGPAAVARPADARRAGGGAAALAPSCSCWTSRRSGSTSSARRRCGRSWPPSGAEHGTTMLLTTHDLADIERLSDRVLVVDGGQVVHTGMLSGLAAGPAWSGCSPSSSPRRPTAPRRAGDQAAVGGGGRAAPAPRRHRLGRGCGRRRVGPDRAARPHHRRAGHRGRRRPPLPPRRRRPIVHSGLGRGRRWSGLLQELGAFASRPARPRRRRGRDGRRGRGRRRPARTPPSAPSAMSSLVLQQRQQPQTSDRPDCASPSTSPSRRCSRSSSASSNPSTVARDRVQPLPGRRPGRRLGDQQAQPGGRAAADPAAQLVQLGDAEPVGVQDRPSRSRSGRRRRPRPPWSRPARRRRRRRTRASPRPSRRPAAGRAARRPAARAAAPRPAARRDVEHGQRRRAGRSPSSSARRSPRSVVVLAGSPPIRGQTT